MCGIFGIFSSNGRNISRIEFESLLANLNHRGPDSSGVWSEEEIGLSLGHTRLAILDLTSAGHQPMHSSSGRFVISFNGEIYNFREIAKDLQRCGISFRGGSDTEVLLEAFQVWGIEKTLQRCNGMFSIALWDRKSKILTLCRDRLGIKPLYYGWNNSYFYFSSELKPIKQSQQFNAHINRDSIPLYMRHNYIPMPYSIYDGIWKLIPGTYLQLSFNELSTKPSSFSPFPNADKCSPTIYWSSRDGTRQFSEYSDEEVVEECYQLLKSAIEYRMISDVPVGVFLSGGIDSSLVVAVMQELSSKSVQSFSIGFKEHNYNEAGYASEVARHLGTDHTELYVTPEEAQAVIPEIPRMYDEPFSDSSQIPTFLVSQLARKHVTVSLSGDGGDELFCGYARYVWANSIWKYLKFWPRSGRRALSTLIQSLSPRAWDSCFSVLNPVIPKSFWSFHDHGEKLYRLADVLSAHSAGELYTKVNTHWDGFNHHPVREAQKVRYYVQDFWPECEDHIQFFSEIDLVTYLPDDILTKVDRASMYCSLEARVPLLDHRLVEFALSLPVRQKIKDGKQKYPLRTLLSRYIPQELIDRPKMGFGVPVGQWLRGPLRDWAEDLLSDGALRKHDYLHVPIIREYWDHHLKGKRNYQYHIWDVLCFQSWYQENF